MRKFYRKYNFDVYGNNGVRYSMFFIFRKGGLNVHEKSLGK